jgi:ribonuclease R
MLQAADRLREVLERRRHSQGSIDFDLPDPQILLDVEGAMTGITVVLRNPAHRMIEEFMLAANRAVARHLEKRERACMFRIHESPDPAKLEVLSRFVKGFGLDLPLSKGAIEPASIQRLLDQAEDGPEYRVVGQLAVRSMQQARYSPENVGHFGLAAKSYCHFTSPIRRYPDLVVHRQLRAQRHGKPDPTADNPSLLQALGKTCSDLERNAEAAERALLQWKKLAFIKDRVGEEFEGVITGVARFGMFVQLVENLVEGLVRVELLGNEWFLFDEGRLRLTGSSSGTTYRLGQRISVRVDRVDRILQRVDFSLSAASADPRPAEFASTGRREKERRTRPRRPSGRSPRKRAPSGRR